MATPQHQTLEVQVKDKILWIGSDAYPVQNIARAQARQLVPAQRKSPVGPFVKSLARAIIIGLVATLVVALAHVKGSTWDNVIWLAVLILIAIAVIRLVRSLMKKDQTYYALVIETAGTPREALVSNDSRVIQQIISQIMRAINGEKVNYHQLVTNFHVSGDVINQSGSYNVGKISA